jgi:hypothetical protein
VSLFGAPIIALWSGRKEAFSIEANRNRARVTEREAQGRREVCESMHKNQIRGNAERNERAKDGEVSSVKA